MRKLWFRNASRKGTQSGVWRVALRESTQRPDQRGLV